MEGLKKFLKCRMPGKARDCLLNLCIESVVEDNGTQETMLQDWGLPHGLTKLQVADVNNDT